jgi:hypothetical protein
MLRTLAIILAISVVGFYLLTEHRAHLFGALPYLLLLSCPLMHFFMHGNHGEHAQHGEHSGKESPKAFQRGGK